MIDRQPIPGDTSGRVPVISPLLHGIAMTGVVFLRSSFGIVYLRDKSIFLSFGYVQLAFTVIAVLESGVFAHYRGEVIFGTAAALLYMMHLATAVIREMRKTGKHDQYSGTSHLLRFTRNPAESTEMWLHLVWEPALILIVALALRFFTNCRGTSNWLVLVAVALACKEMINYWSDLRRGKRGEDMRDDTKTAVTRNVSDVTTTQPGKTARKEKVKRRRASDEEENKAEARFAAILQMTPPYTLEQANQNYRDLIKECHPDTNEGSAENIERAAQLNKSLEFFRQKFEC